MDTNGQRFWDSRAALGATAGSQDTIAAELERRAILAHIYVPSRVFEAGCGTGQLAIEMARRGAAVFAIDASQAMIDQAKARTPVVDGRLLNARFAHASLEQFYWQPEFDFAVTQRCIINCGDWDAQQQAIRNILALLVPGGQYIMCECSADGLAATNALRGMVDLPYIMQPEHNRYLVDAEVCELAAALQREGIAELRAVYHPLSTYALLSRVVNARIAANEGKAPAYDSPINELALKLPSIGDLGQNVVWVWRRL